MAEITTTMVRKALIIKLFLILPFLGLAQTVIKINQKSDLLANDAGPLLLSAKAKSAEYELTIDRQIMQIKYRFHWLIDSEIPQQEKTNHAIYNAKKYLSGLSYLDKSFFYEEPSKTKPKKVKKLTELTGGKTIFIEYADTFLYEEVKFKRIQRLKEEALEDGHYVIVKNGSMLEQGNFLNQKKQGKYSFFHTNGKLKEQGIYEQGKQTGEWVFFLLDGRMSEKRNFKNGKLHGIQHLFHDNGKLKERSNYVNGNKEGRYTHYNQQGKLLEEGNYKAGNKSGKWTNHIKRIYETYDDAGKLVKKETFEGKRLVATP